MSDTNQNTEPVNKEAPEEGARIEEYITTNNGASYGLDGPLARAYSVALDELYKKDKDPITGLSMETQELDEDREQKGWIAAKGPAIDMDGNIEDMGMLYGVGRGEITHKTIIEVTDKLQRMAGKRRDGLCIIIDADYSNERGPDGVQVSKHTVLVDGQINRSSQEVGGVLADSPLLDHQRVYGLALESLAARHGVRVYKSLGEFIRMNS